MGDAGVGKSRLLYELRKAVTNEEVTFLEGKCLSYSRGVAYHPVADILRTNFELRDGDEDIQVRDKVQRGLRQLQADEVSTLPYLLELLSVKDSGMDKIPLSPEGKRDHTIQALNRIVLRGAEKGPLILAVEDLHWMDKSSEAAFKELLEHIAGAKVLLLFTYRTEYVHTWGARSYHSQVTLNRLSNRETLALVTHLLATEGVPENLENLILEKTEGVPFFVEEFVKSLKDLKIIEPRDHTYALVRDPQDITIPSTIQEVIMARVDALPEEAKGVLQTGAVMGREFSYDLMATATSLPERELLSCLAALKDSEILYERGVYPQSTYIFKHALSQEVVYGSILTVKKKELHGKVAEAMEQIYKNNLTPHHGILAEHYRMGGNYEKAAGFCALAEKAAWKNALNSEALVYAKRRVDSLGRLPQTMEIERKIIDARTALSFYHISMNHYVEAKKAVEPIVESALRLGDRRRLIQIYTVLGAYYSWVKEDFSKSQKYFQDALIISEELNDRRSSYLANYWFAVLQTENCQFEEAHEGLRKALRVNEAANSIWGMAIMKANIGDLYFWQGKIDLGFELTTEAVRLAEKSGDISSNAATNYFHGLCCYGKGLFEESEKACLKSIYYGEKLNLMVFHGFTMFVLGEVYAEMGEYGKACDCYEKCIEDLQRGGGIHPPWSRLSHIAIAKTKVMNQERDIDLDRLYGLATANQLKCYESWMLRHIAEILLNIDEKHFGEAEHWIQKAIEADQKYGMRFHLGRDYAIYANMFQRQGDNAKAREYLGKAIEIYRECGADGWQHQAERELAHLT